MLDSKAISLEGKTLSVSGYAAYAIEKGAKCAGCGGTVFISNIRHYDHDGGWKVEGYEKLQWLYFECPNTIRMYQKSIECGGQTSFTKLYIPRPNPFTN